MIAPAPMLAILDALDRSTKPEVHVRSGQCPLNPRRTAYIIRGKSAAAVHRAIADIMESVENGQADFVRPYLRERRGALQFWEAKGIVERAP
jgi:hypothetical protein